jgi:hypothetical protein
MATWQDVEEIALGLTGARAALSVKVSVWARLDLLDRTELTEVLTDSWKARRGVRG